MSIVACCHRDKHGNTGTGKSANSHRLNLQRVSISTFAHLLLTQLKKKSASTFSDTPTKEGNVNTGCGTHRAQWRWQRVSPSSWSPRGQSRRPRSRRSRCWLPLSLSCSAHSWQSTGRWIRRWFCEICSLLGDERKIHGLAKSKKGKGAGKDAGPRRNDGGTESLASSHRRWKPGAEFCSCTRWCWASGSCFSPRTWRSEGRGKEGKREESALREQKMMKIPTFQEFPRHQWKPPHLWFLLRGGDPCNCAFNCRSTWCCWEEGEKLIKTWEAPSFLNRY